MERKTLITKKTKRSVDSAKRTRSAIEKVLDNLHESSAPTPLTPEQAYTTIIEWLYQSDKAFPTAQKWRVAFVGHLGRTLKRIK